MYRNINGLVVNFQESTTVGVGSQGLVSVSRLRVWTSPRTIVLPYTMIATFNKKDPEETLGLFDNQRTKIFVVTKIPI